MSVRRDRNRGFTLAETLVAMLILLMASAILAMGVPTAIDTYHKVTDAANAHVLVSTTMMELKDKLSLAYEIEINDKNNIDFVDANGRSFELCNNGNNAVTVGSTAYYGLYLQGMTTDESALLVSDSAAAKNLYAKYDNVSLKDGYVKFEGIAVFRKDDDHELVRIDEYDVKVLNYRD